MLEVVSDPENPCSLAAADEPNAKRETVEAVRDPLQALEELIASMASKDFTCLPNQLSEV